MGSWQDKGAVGDYMWIRDFLPQAQPTMRVTLFGYDTALRGSHSFQSPYDIASHLVKVMETGGWNEPSAKPVIFLAHSLGGIIIKQVFISISTAPPILLFSLFFPYPFVNRSRPWNRVGRSHRLRR